MNGIHWCWIIYKILYQFLFVNLFLFLIICRVLARITISSFFLIWVFIETTVFFTIPIIANSSRSRYNTESLIIYFIYQAVARILIIAGIIENLGDYNSLLIMIGILVKLGVFPFHVWVLPVLRGCSLQIFFLLLVPIKLPIYLLSENFIRVLIVPVIISIIVGIILAINQSSLLKVIAARRISSTGVLLFCLNVDVFNYYFIGYSISILILLYRLSSSNRILLFFGVLSLLGLPLLPLFIPKLTLLVNSSVIFPFFSLFVLIRFIISSLYYVKFLPRRIIKFDSKRFLFVSGAVLFSFFSLF